MRSGTEEYREFEKKIEYHQGEIRHYREQQAKIRVIREMPLLHCGARGSGHYPHNQMTNRGEFTFCPGDEDRPPQPPDRTQPDPAL